MTYPAYKGGVTFKPNYIQIVLDMTDGGFDTTELKSIKYIA